ncbi:MAG TPA: PIN domain-containing protein [Dehalococcoidia bacterium]|nr:PIN domain-containing protein [Dehalococcoidia bacterium]
MIVDRTTVVFFDASALFAAALSPTGGAALILSVCERGLLIGTASQGVLDETERDLENKRPGPAWYRLSQRITSGAIRVPTEPTGGGEYPAINQKDAHVYAAAVAAGSDYLITLDRGLIREANTAAKRPLALLPGDFITKHLKLHPDYEDM